jgi:transcriptional regulator with XRE-family HTH domain
MEKKPWKNCNRFSEKLAQRILQLGLNGQKLARKSDVSDSEISRIMNQKSLPGLENAIALARAVGVSLDYLADDALDVDPNQPKESAGERETTIQRLAREIGFKQAEYLLEYSRIIGYEVAMQRLVEAAKPIVTLPDPARNGAVPVATTGRANSA